MNSNAQSPPPPRPDSSRTDSTSPRPPGAKRGDRALVAAAVVLSLALYGLTVAPGVLWQDSAMFQHRVVRFDLFGAEALPLAHPLYIILAKPLTWLPIGDLALRVNLFSAACGAACIGFLASLLLHLTRSRLAALAGTALLAVSHTFWTHAVIAEVYALYSLALVIELWALARFFRRRHWPWLLAALFINGLNASNHLLALLHLPAYGGIIAWSIRTRRIRPAQLPVFLAAFVVGAVPYLSLIAARIAGGDPAGAVLAEALVGTPQRSEHILAAADVGRSILYFGLNFPTPLALLAPLGVWYAARRRELRWFALFAGAVFSIDFVFAVSYDVPDQFVFFTPCYALFAAFAALGIRHICGTSARRLWACLALALLPALAYEIGPGLLQRGNIAVPGVKRSIPFRDDYAYFLRPRKNGETSAARFAREALAIAGPDGLLIADTTILNALIYVRDIEGLGRGVTLPRDSADIRPDPPAIDPTPDALRRFANRNKAFVCTDRPEYLRAWPFILDEHELRPTGPIFRLHPVARAHQDTDRPD